MANRTAVKEKCRRHRMPEDVSRDLLRNPGLLRNPRKYMFETIDRQSTRLPVRHEERLLGILSPAEITLHPLHRLLCEEDRSLLIPFPNDLCLTALDYKTPTIK